MIVEYTASFDRHFSKLIPDIQKAAKETIRVFLAAYGNRSFPNGLRMHKCGPFLSLSVTMNYRLLVSPIPGGVRFVFIGDHDDADDYLKRK